MNERAMRILTYQGDKPYVLIHKDKKTILKKGMKILYDENRFKKPVLSKFTVEKPPEFKEELDEISGLKNIMDVKLPKKEEEMIDSNR